MRPQAPVPRFQLSACTAEQTAARSHRQQTFSARALQIDYNKSAKDKGKKTGSLVTAREQRQRLPINGGDNEPEAAGA